VHYTAKVLDAALFAMSVVRTAHHYMLVPVLTSPYKFNGCRVNLQGESGEVGVTRLVPEMQHNELTELCRSSRSALCIVDPGEGGRML